LTATSFPDQHHRDIAIIGAGLSGLAAAHAVREYRHGSLIVFERAAEVGGTWRDNTYPGCACDVPSHLYQLSFAPKTDWSRRYAPQVELDAYAQEIAYRFALRPFIRFNSKVDTVQFDDASGVWRLFLADGAVFSARTVIAATGPLSQPRIPEFPGRESFRGTIVHTAQWRQDLLLAGKRVVVTGTGASAVQLVPAIAEKVAQLYVLQRTAPWILPRHDRPAPPLSNAIYRRFPMLHALRRWQIFAFNEIRTLALSHAPKVMALVEHRAKRIMRAKIKEERLASLLTPPDRMGCRRILLSDDYHTALSKPNVHLIPAPLSHFVPQGVATADGQVIEADILIMATGFKGNRPLSGLKVVGPGGRDLHETWATGPEAHLGVAIAGFPNFFCILGPNSGSGTTSVLLMAESQIQLIMHLLSLAQERGADRIEVKPAAQADFNAWVRWRSARSVWGSRCRSWYKTADQRNVAIFPDLAVRFRTMCRKAAENDFIFSQQRHSQQD
jgi:cation diffusion facilitator CzcD-associated flavoprotein CzcO